MAEEVSLEFQPLLEDEDTHIDDLLAIEPERPPHRRRIWLTVLICIVVLALVGGSSLYWLMNRTPPVTYTQATITSGNISTKISATGPVNANAVYALNFSVAGQVSSINAQIGQHVNKGQVLARVTIDKTALQSTIDQDQLAVTSAQQSLDSANQGLTNAQDSAGNTQSQNALTVQMAADQEKDALAACNTQATAAAVTPVPTPGKTPVAVPTVAADCWQLAQDKYAQAQGQATSSNTSAQNQITSAQNQITSAQNALDRANAQLKSAQDSLNNADTSTQLTAPASGTIAAISGVLGQNVSASGTTTGSSSSSSSSSSGFMTLIDASGMSIAAQVNEADIGNVQVGQPAQFTVAAYPSTTFRASVSSFEIIGQTSSNVVTYTVHLAVDMQSLNATHVYPGMTATVNITTAQRIGALLVPTSAISFTSTALQANEVNRAAIQALIRGAQGTSTSTGSTLTAQGSSKVVLALRNGVLTPIVITTGLSSGQYTEVLSGLKENDQVVVGQTGGATSSTTTRTGTGGTGTGGFGGGGTGGGGTGGGTRIGTGG